MIYCSDESIYTGITTDISRRWKEHLTTKNGAKYFRGRKPVSLLYLEQSDNRSQASQREYHIKQQPRNHKIALSQQQHQTTLSLLERLAPALSPHYHIKSSGIS